MSTSFLLRLNITIKQLEHTIIRIFVGPKFPPDPLCLAATTTDKSCGFLSSPKRPTPSLKDIFDTGILWAVPKFRRSIEKRWKRKFGLPEYHLKILTPKTNLRVCNKCGGHHEVGLLCATCYKIVNDETKEMQEKIKNELGINPVEQEVIVLYDGEKGQQTSEFWNGKRIVEMEKPRPIWFSKNLMQKSTQPAATTKEIKPNDLG